MKYIKLKIVRIFFSFVLLTVGLSICLYANTNYKKIEHRIVDFQDKNFNTLYLRTTDMYDEMGNISLHEFFGQNDSLSKMKEFNTEIKSEFDFLEINNQSLVVESDLKFDDKFRVDYEKSYFDENTKTNNISLNSIQIGDLSYDYFELNSMIIEGNGFDDNDFNYYGTGYIPVILGYEYIDFLEIGDVFKMNYLTKTLELEVVGFLAKDTTIITNFTNYLCDRFLIIPFFNFLYSPTNDEDEYFQKIHYSLKNWGYIKINDGEDFNTYQAKFDSINDSFKLSYILNDTYIVDYIINSSNTLYSSKGLFLISSVFLFIILAVVCLFIYILDYRSNKKIYAIHLVCGCNILKIKQRIYTKIVVQFVISIVLAVLININIIGSISNYDLQRYLFYSAIDNIVIISVLIITTLIVLLNVYINKSNIYADIQKER